MSGVVFTPAAADRIGRAVRWVESRRQAGDQPVGPARGVEPVWVRLTSGTADGDGHYPGVITLYSGAGEAWSDYSAVKVAPLNGETLSDATRYAVRASGRTPGGDELYTVIGTTESAGTVSVDTVDGTPAYAGVTTIRFDEADWVVLTQPSPGIVRIDLAAATDTQAGVVTTDLQTFGGRKTFLDQAVFKQESSTLQELWAGRFCQHAEYGWGVTVRRDGDGAESGLYGTDDTYFVSALSMFARSSSFPNGAVFQLQPSGIAHLMRLDADGNSTEGGTGGARMHVYGRFSATDPLVEIGTGYASGHGATGYLSGGEYVVGGIVVGDLPDEPGTGDIDFGTW